MPRERSFTIRLAGDVLRLLATGVLLTTGCASTAREARPAREATIVQSGGASGIATTVRLWSVAEGAAATVQTGERPPRVVDLPAPHLSALLRELDSLAWARPAEATELPEGMRQVCAEDPGLTLIMRRDAVSVLRRADCGAWHSTAKRYWNRVSGIRATLIGAARPR